MKRTLFIFGLFALSMLLLFNLSRYTLLSGNISAELILAFAAIAFFFLGILFYRKVRAKALIEEHAVDYLKIKEFKITEREYDVLRELSKNLSNKRIAEGLYLSESTIKTHVSSLLKKLDVENRMQLTEKARQHKLV